MSAYQQANGLSGLKNPQRDMPIGIVASLIICVEDNAFHRELRRMTEREKRLLEVIGEDAMEEIKRRDSVGPPSVLVA